MQSKTIAIVGAGITGIMAAYELTRRGYSVHLFEKGLPYPSSAELFQLTSALINPNIPAINPAFREVISAGRALGADLSNELRMHVGGMATDWEGITLRFHPNDFRLGTLYGRGIDWPLTYDDLEPYYGQADRYLGVSGTDEDNPFAPPRSEPYPLPPFEITYTEERIKTRLLDANVVAHSTPQARTRQPYDGRPGCQNIGTCRRCPLLARYFPAFHLNQALATENLTLHTNTSIRRIITENGRVSGLLVHENDAAEPYEFGADLVILSAGALHNARLLLLSANDQYPDGIGNTSGHVGRHLLFNQLRLAQIRLPFPNPKGQIGFWTLQTQQFADHDARNQYGGVKFEFYSKSFDPSPVAGNLLPSGQPSDAERFREQVLDQTPFLDAGQTIGIHAESDSTENKYMTLSDTTDPLGDPQIKVQFDVSGFDEETLAFSESALVRMAGILGSTVEHYPRLESWETGNHHMGTTRMSADPADGVTDSFGKLHDTEGVYLMGAGNFSNSISLNPTLTLMALAFRTMDYIFDQELT